MVTCDTPPVAKSKGFTFHSAKVLRSIILVLSACMPMKNISPITLDCGARVGIPAPNGICEVTLISFSLTIWRALKISVPQSNSTQTNEKPCDEEERTLRTSVAPLTAVSMGKVTSRSTSSGAIPWASVITTTVGAVRSGNTSTSMLIAVRVPTTISITEHRSTKYLLFSENFMILSSITFHFSVHDQNVDRVQRQPEPV